jgi:hypothetical protein
MLMLLILFFSILLAAVLSAFIGPDQDATETLLASDPDVAPWVEKYQRSRETVSRTDYEVSLFIYIYISNQRKPKFTVIFFVFLSFSG